MTSPQRFSPFSQLCFLASWSVLLLFTQAGCGPAEEVIIMNPELEARPLPPESPVETSLGEGEAHRYTFTVPSGQASRLWVEQRRQDVLLEVGDQEHRLLLSVDSPSGDTGTESVLLLADDDEARFLVDVRPFSEAAEGGGYRIILEPPRPVTADLRTLRDAEWASTRGYMTPADQPGEARRHSRAAVEGFRRLQGLRFDQEPETWVDCQLASNLLQLGQLTKRGDSDHPGDPEAALELFMEAAAIERRLGRAEPLVALLNEQVATRLEIYRDEGLLEIARESVEKARQLDDSAFLAEALSSLGDAARWQAQNRLALEAWEEALRLYEALPLRKRGQANIHLRLGQYFLAQQAAEEAAHHLERSRRLQLEDQGWVSSLTRSALASLSALNARRAERRGDSPQPHLEEAVTLLRGLLEESPAARQRAGFLSQLGTVHLQADQPSEAATYFEQALALYRDVPGADQHVAMGRHKLGRARFREGRLEDALELHRLAFVGIDPDDTQGRTSVRFAEARALFHLDRPEEAREILESLIQDAESLRSDSGGVSLRQAYVASRRHYWELYVATLTRLHQRSPSPELAERALEVATRAQARALLDLVLESVAEARDATAPSALEERSRVVAQLEQVESALLDLAPEERQGEAAHRLERRRLDLLAQLQRVNREVSKSLDGTVLQAEPLTVAEIRRQILEPGVSLLMYFVGEELSTAWLLTPDSLNPGSLTMVELPSRRDLERQVRAFTETLPRRSPDSVSLREAAGHRLSASLLQPLAPRLTGEHLLVVADGVLHGVPFATLPLPRDTPGVVSWNQRQPLVADHFQVSRLPSPAVLITLRQREERRDRKRPRRPGRGPLLAVVANPDFGSEADSRPAETRAWEFVDDLEPLPFSAKEAAGLMALVGDPDRTLQALGPEANRQLFESGRLSGYPILHLATHAYVDTEHPELSTLVLSGRDAEGHIRPALLQLYELYELELPAELVVLSACRTARGEPVRGEGMVGLTRGFLHAGATRVIHSLWNVDDEATRELMLAFYRALLRGSPPAAALQQAQGELRATELWSAPVFWAGFVLTGDWRPLPSLAAEDGSRGLGSDDDIGQKITGAENPPPPPPEDDLPAPIQRPPSERGRKPPVPAEAGGGDG